MIRAPVEGVSRSARHRPAAILVVAMVVLLVLSLLGAELVRTIVLAHHRSRNQQRQTQAVWLAESGIARGLAQVSSDPDYGGETWQPVPAEAARDEEPLKSKVIITIEKTDAGRQLRVEAHYPDDPTDRVSVERVHPLPSTSEATP